MKPQLVHYYFRTMDDLFLALYPAPGGSGPGAPCAGRCLVEQPLWAFWDLSRDPRGTGLTMEFIALANHRKEIRAEITESAERFRIGLLEGFRALLGRYEVDQQRIPAAGVRRPLDGHLHVPR